MLQSFRVNRMKDKKYLGLWSVVSIGVGGMVGAGIFAIFGVVGQVSGTATYISYIIAGILALLCAYSYSFLSIKYPSAGGPVEFLIRGFGPGIFSGGLNVLLWIGYIFGISFLARAFGGYAVTFIPTSSTGFWMNIFAAAILVMFTAINFIGAKAVGRSELTIVGIKIAVLILFAAIGAFTIKSSYLTIAQWPSSPNILMGAAIVFLGYVGFGLITNAAEDVENPQRMIPRAMFISVFITIAIYVAVSVVVAGNLPMSKVVAAKDYALAEAAKPFLGTVGFRIIALTALLSTASAINAQIYGGANVSYMIAREGELPEVFERKVWGHGIEGLFITSALAIVCSIFLNLDGIAKVGSASFLLIYATVNLAHIRLRKTTGANLFVLILSVIGCLAAFGTLVYNQIKTSPSTLIILIGVIIFSFFAEWLLRYIYHRELQLRGE